MFPAALALGVVLAVWATGFDASAPGRHLLGTLNDDALHAVHLHDQVHTALADGRLTLADPDQFVPFGDHTVGHNGGNVLEALVTGALRLGLPWPSWWSLGVLAWIPLNLLAFLPLGRGLWPRAPVVTLGLAAAWSIYPPFLGQMDAGRLTQVALVGLPLAVLGLLRLVEDGGRAGQVLTAVGLTLTGLGYWFYAVFLLWLVPLFWLHGARHRGGLRAHFPAIFAPLLRAAGLTLALVGPFVLIVLYERFGHGASYGASLSAEVASPDFRDAVRLDGELSGHVRGWLPLTLAGGMLLGLWRGRRRALWLGGALVCVVFALGPGQHVGEHMWLLPSWPVWRFVPGMDAMNHPERWLAVFALFALVLSGEGLARLGRGGLVGALVLPIGVAWAGVQAGHVPFGGWQLQVPAVWQDLAEASPAEGSRGAVIVLPIGRSQSACAYKPFVRRPLLGGMVENQPWSLHPDWVDFVSHSPLLVSLWALGTGQDHTVPVVQDDLDRLRAAGFDRVLLDQKFWGAVFEAQRVPVVQRLDAAFGPAAHSDSSGAWWWLPSEGSAGPAPDLGYTFQLNGPPGEDPKAGRKTSTAPQQGPDRRPPTTPKPPPAPAGGRPSGR